MSQQDYKLWYEQHIAALEALHKYKEQLLKGNNVCDILSPTNVAESV